MIPEKYLKLDMPIVSMQVVGQTPQPNNSSQLDAMFFTATMYVAPNYLRL